MKEKKSTIFKGKARKELVPNTYQKRTICKVHMELAHEINDYMPESAKKRDILNLVDEVFNMGKRMDERLAFYRKNLISNEYRQQNIALHNRAGGFGGSGHRWAPQVFGLLVRFGFKSVLDFGCGQSTLWAAVKEFGDVRDILYSEYDPAVFGKDSLPLPAELVTCTDVLEHIEPEYMENVLEILSSLTEKAIFFNIAIHLANKVLPDGRNAHISLKSILEWKELLARFYPESEWTFEDFPTSRPKKDFLLLIWKKGIQ